MKFRKLNQFIFTVNSLAILSLGFAQVSVAGVIDTQHLIDAENRQNAVSRIEATLMRQDVAEQLLAQGVEPSAVMVRVQNLTTAELMLLDGQINEQIAGGGAVGIIGAVFLVLLILELVGVTDIFKAI